MGWFWLTFWLLLFGTLTIASFLYHKKAVNLTKEQRRPRGGLSQYGLLFGTATLFIVFAQFAVVPWPITPIFWVAWVVCMVVVWLLKFKPGLIVAYVMFAVSTLTVLTFTPTPHNLFF